MENLKKTPLNEKHKSLGAKMVSFGGWEMPIQYTGIIAEHENTRKSAGLFDVSHMGEIFVEGKPDKILGFLEKLTCNSINSLKNFQVQYNAILNKEGGIVDDVTVYKFSDEKYMICSNASNYEDVFSHLISFPHSVNIRNESLNWHQIAIQGPKADEIFSKYIDKNLDFIKYYSFALIPFQGEELIVSRTGYTGEDGFEIYSSISLGLKIWDELLSFGKPFGLVPVGLGARDTLRIEAKYPLYGHELTSYRTPVESGIGWIVKKKDKEFLCYDKIILQKKENPPEKILGIQLLDPGVLRENYSVFDLAKNPIGKVTSGTYSPTLKKSIGMAILKKGFWEDGTEILIEIRSEFKKAVVHTGNFITGSIKKN
ncbi:MAG: glycine cleavage system aminomethyltransferase GcvT [Leptospiraceae bacterium]|nr:glycine cleavage system aminomethyltransferase GcvT [Leptospiraceae bacterium]MCK6380379.1 glycine cleavage system aminomethyltransferase GcvT [Leptospiraceae bacterium]NUM41310.1 glycine cleavage system aminomethyltransferase GcvT [Leptospiraceae bacterium]